MQSNSRGPAEPSQNSLSSDAAQRSERWELQTRVCSRAGQSKGGRQSRSTRGLAPVPRCQPVPTVNWCFSLFLSVFVVRGGSVRGRLVCLQDLRGFWMYVPTRGLAAVLMLRLLDGDRMPRAVAAMTARTAANDVMQECTRRCCTKLSVNSATMLKVTDCIFSTRRVSRVCSSTFFLCPCLSQKRPQSLMFFFSQACCWRHDALL